MLADDHRSPTRPTARVVAGFALAAPLVAYMLPGLAAALPALRRPLGIEDCTPDGRGYALTFDDGPHPLGTPAVLALLAQAQAPATFFLVGEQVQHDPALAREIVAAGHGVGANRTCRQCSDCRGLQTGQVAAGVKAANGQN